MNSKLFKSVQEVFEKIRPQIKEHGGDIELALELGYNLSDAKEWMEGFEVGDEKQPIAVLGEFGELRKDCVQQRSVLQQGVFDGIDVLG